MPFSSTRIMTGGNTPGMLAEAVSTSRNSARASSPAREAMAPRSQMTDSSLSRSVVATRSIRPFAASADHGGLGEALVPRGSQEGERRDERPGAHSRDELELRTGSLAGEPDERARPE